MSADTLSQLLAGQLSGCTRLDLSCGLTEFPREIFDLAGSLEILNLSGNRLSSLPDDLGRLTRLRILFCSDNLFTHLPTVLGACPRLTMIGFRANQIETVDEAAFPPDLRWLILTDNRLRHLPATLGRCSGLRKLMLSGNLLESLPAEMAGCVNLELLRLAANRFRELPDWLLALPRLSWLALAGNPLTDSHRGAGPELEIASIDWAALHLQDKLGEGASGIIHKALWQPAADAPARAVAVKLFKSAVTSDGLPASEMAASLGVGAHPHLTEVLGRISQHPGGNEGLVMSLIAPTFRNLADPPSFETCTRDVYAEDLRLSFPAVLRMAHGIASAAVQLHARGILHGDLYAHNILWKTDGECLLSDFGAAAFYDVKDARLAAGLERIEVRAFGYWLEELLALTDRETTSGVALQTLQAQCCQLDAAARPRFDEILEFLTRLRRASDSSS